MAANPEKPDFKKEFRAMAQGSQSLTVAYIGWSIAGGIEAIIVARRV
jgi:hypothetical protein